jgi:acetyl esterase/lipase
VVAAGEYSPLVAAAAGVVAAAAARRRVGRTHGPGPALVAAGAAAVAAWPAVQAVRVTRAAEAATARLGPPAPPTPAHDGAVSERAVRYPAADGRTELTLRLVRPRAAPGVPAGARPTLVVLYGGAWQRGAAGQSAAVDRRFAARGYTVVALDYRHAPAFRHPAPLDDVRRGLALVRDSAAAWGADPARVVLWGRSSGAHLALLAAWAPDGAEVRPPPVRGVIDEYGPYDLAAGYADPPRPDPIDVRAVLRAYAGGAPRDAGGVYRAASPASYVRPGLPPALLVYGGRDHVVLPRFGRAAAAALGRSGVPAVYAELPWAEHGFDLAPGGLGARVAERLAEGFAARVTR